MARVKLVGRPKHIETYDRAAQQEHLASLAMAVQGIIDAQDWRLGGIPKNCLEIKVNVGEGSLHWSMRLAIEKAQEAVLNRHKAAYFWEGTDKAPAIRKDLDDLENDVARLRASIRASADEAWDLCRTGMPAGLDGSAYPGLDGQVSCSYSCHFLAASGKVECPVCGEHLLDNADHLNNWGLLSCHQCDAILAESENCDLGIPDGIRRIGPGDVPDQALHEVLGLAHEDDSRFHQFGPFTDWKAGELRIHAAFKDGRIIGFSTWNNVGDEIPALRIVWVHSDYRRQGFGRALLDAEAADIATFAVESPSEDFLALLTSTGYMDTKKILSAPGG